jgi:DNA-binding transcriptional MocR family regulator
VTKYALIRGKSAREIASHVEQAIRQNALLPGDPLPSVRDLAGDLGVSPATAASAYRILRERALIVAEQRRGVRVSERPPLGSLRLVRSLPAHVVDLASGNPDPSLLPDLNAALAAISPPQRLYGSEGSLPALLEELTREPRNFTPPGSQAVVVAGGLDGIERVLQAHLRPGDIVAVEDPCYTGLRDLVRSLGMRDDAMPVDEQGVTAHGLRASLASGASAVVITPRAQNPTGSAITAQRSHELRSVLDEYPACLVIEDDHVADVSSVPRQRTIADRRTWALVRSMNKAYGPDLRVGVVMGDEETISRVEGRQSVGYGWVSTLLQHLALHLLTDASTQELVARAATQYGIRRQALVDALRAVDVACIGSSGFNIWVPVPEEDAVVQSLIARGWAVRPGEAYRIRSGPGVRITTASLRIEDAPRLAADISAALRPMRRQRHA